jgi:translation initiation factor 2 subunit 2
MDDPDLEMLNLLTKKKKPKRHVVQRFSANVEAEENEGTEGTEGTERTKATVTSVTSEMSVTGNGSFTWSGTDRYYEYDELLKRAFGSLREMNPELYCAYRKTVMMVPRIAREGPRKVVFLNFKEMCESMSRSQEHFMSYILAELNTTGSIDGQQRMVIKARLQPQHVETIVRKYFIEYVMCAACKRGSTILDRDSNTRVVHLRCGTCGASRTVQPVVAGFSAVMTRR